MKLPKSKLTLQQILAILVLLAQGTILFEMHRLLTWLATQPPAVVAIYPILSFTSLLITIACLVGTVAEITSGKITLFRVCTEIGTFVFANSTLLLFLA